MKLENRVNVRESNLINKNIYMENTMSGITLIALVITIIVLLVLAGIVISMVQGNNGILTKTKVAVRNNKDAQEQEELQLVVIAARLAGMGNLTTDNLNNELRNQSNNSELEVTEVPVGWIYNGYTIYKDGLIKKGEILVPIEYTQVEYIESTGTQYIDTGFSPQNLKLNYKFEFAFTDIAEDGTYNRVFGNYIDDDTNAVRFQYRVSIGNRYYPVNNTKVRSANVIIDNALLNDVFYKCELNDSEFKINNTVYNLNNTDGVENNTNIALFTSYVGNENRTPLKIKFFSIYDSENNIIRNYIPCEDPSNNVGLYETVTKTFLANAGTGTFKAGNDL